jgi:hypothetical protein
MSMSYKNADDCLNTKLRDSATPYLQLHTGSPGAEGTANIAQKPSSGAIVRKSISFAAPTSHPSNTERRVLSSSAVTWNGTEIASGQEITHFSIWSASTGGQPEFISTVSQAKTTGSDGVSIAAGDIEVAIGVFAKPA